MLLISCDRESGNSKSGCYYRKLGLTFEDLNFLHNQAGIGFKTDISFLY